MSPCSFWHWFLKVLSRSWWSSLLLCVWCAAPSAPAKFRAGDTSLEMAAAWCVLGGCHLHALSFPALSCLGAIGFLPSCLPAACWGRSWVFIRAGGTAYMQGQGQRQPAANISTKQAVRPAEPSPCCWQHVLSKPRTCSYSGLPGASAHVLFGKPQANLFHWTPSPSSLPNAFQPWPCPASCAVT